MRLLPCLSVFLALWSLPLGAHEFWIAPLDYTIEPGGKIKAEIRVGQDFNGPAYPYIPDNFRRFDLVSDAGIAVVTGRIGDRPALSTTATTQGLVTVVHVTRDYLLTYKDWDTFALFARDKDLRWAMNRHLERGYTRDRVRERYSRYAKSLIAVGDGDGADHEIGLLTEVVALANPYTDDLSDGFPVRVLYRGEPRADAQLDVFARDAAGVVTRISYHTDADGFAAVPVKPGVEYLLDAVVLREIEPENENGPVWESLWASLTFLVPG